MRTLLLLLLLMAAMPQSYADTAATYRHALSQAAQGQLRAAQEMLGSIHNDGPDRSIWPQRAAAAGVLLSMRMDQQIDFPPQSFSAQSGPNSYLSLASAYASTHPLIRDGRRWMATLLAVILPGAGHAWQGRWHDAGTAALMVWPMLILTIWAALRKMGPVTLFFALITIWLWSGTVFSSISLAERGNAESYMLWWQGVWQASGLPGRPW